MGISVVWALPVERLYDAEVVVPDSGQVAFREGTRDALLEVLIRVSGRSDIGTDTELLAELDYAYKMVAKYTYHRHTYQEDGEEKQGQLLQVTFHGHRVDELLQKYQQPVWPANRPLVLIWLVIDTPQGRRAFDPEIDIGIRDVFEKAARRRGVPVIFPQYELGEAAPIDAVWSLNESELLTASAPYKADFIIAGRASLTSSGRWLGAWSQFYQGHRERFDIDTYNTGAVVDEAIDRVADQLAGQFAIWPGVINDGGLAIQVQGAYDFYQYHQLMLYLEGLKVTDTVVVNQLQADSVSLTLTLKAGQGQLLEALALDGYLSPVTKKVISLGEAEAPTAMQFQWKLPDYKVLE